MSDSKSPHNCPKCKAYYNDKSFNGKKHRFSHFPRIIPGCNHNICEACLATEGRRNGQVRCAVPGCAVVAPWSASELDNFPRDFYLMGSWTHRRQEELPGSDHSVNFRPTALVRDDYMCGECERRLALWTCTACGTNFCKECFNMVHNSKELLRHNRSTIRGGFQDNLALISQFTDHGKPVDLRSSEVPSPKESENLDELILHGTSTLLRLKAARDSLQQDPEVKPYVDIQRKIQAQMNAWHRQLQTLQHGLESQIEEIEKSEEDRVNQLADSILSRIQEIASLLRIANLAKKDATNFDVLKITHLLQVLQHESSTVAYTPGVLHVEINPEIGELLNSGLQLHKEKQFSVQLDPSSEYPQSSRDSATDTLMSLAERNFSITNANSSEVNYPPIVPYYESAATSSNCSKSSAADEATCSRTRDGNRFYDRNSLLKMKNSPESMTRPNFKELIPEVTGASDKKLVIVCHRVNPGKFFVQFVKSFNKLNNVMEIVNTLENGTPPDSESMKVGDLVVARFSADGKLYRGSVLSIEKISYKIPTIEIHFVDYGNCEEVNLSDLRISSEDINCLPPFAKECTLFGIRPKASKEWSDASIDSFANLTNSSLLITEIDQIGETSYIDLRRLESEEMRGNSTSSISDVLVMKNLAEFSSPSPKKLADLMDRSGFFSLDSLKEGENHKVFVSHVTDPSMLAVQLIGEHRTWATCVSSLVDEMQSAYGNKTSNGHWSTFTPQVGMPCAAAYSVDRKYYRALIIRQSGIDQYEVQFVDFGNSEVVDRCQMRELFDKFRKVPAMAVNVSLSDVIPTGVTWPLQSSLALKRMTQCKELLMHVDVTPQQGTPCQVYLYETAQDKDVCINAKLIDEGFAVSKSGINLQVEYPKFDTGPVKRTDVENPKDNLIQKLVWFSETDKGLNSKTRTSGTFKPSKDSEDRSSGQLIQDKIIPDNVETDRQCLVTHMVSPSRLYVRNLEDSEQFSLFSLSLQMNVLKNTPKLQTIEPYCIGQTCVVLDDSQAWARGTIVKVNPDVVTVYLIDSGKVQEVFPLPDFLRSLPDQFSDDPPFCQPVHMTNIQPTGGTYRWSAKAREKMKSWLDDYEHIVTVKNDGTKFLDESSGLTSQPVELFVEKITDMGPLEPLNREKVSLSRKLTDRGLALPVRNWEIYKKAFAITENVGLDADVWKLAFANKSMQILGDLNNEKIQSTGSFHWQKGPLLQSDFIGTVSHVDQNGYIYIQPKQNQETVNTIRHILNSKYQDSKPKPHDLYWFPNQSCIALFGLDQNWCRGKVLRQFAQNVFEVLFVDFGNAEKVEAGNLRKNMFVQQLPEQCFQLKLGEVDIVGSAKKVIGFLRELLVDQSVEVTITKRMPLEGNLKTMAGKDVAEHLIQCGYAVKTKNMLAVITETEEPMNEDSLQALSKDNENERKHGSADTDVEKIEVMTDKFELESVNNVLESVENYNDSFDVELDDDTDFMSEFCFDSPIDDTITSNSDSFDMEFEEDTDCIVESDADALSEVSFSFNEGDEFSAVYIFHLSRDVVCCYLLEDSKNPYATGFKILSDELQKVGEKQKMLLKRPKRNEMVIARNNLDGKWCRALIVDPSKMKVIFVDYGNSSVVDEIRRLPEGFEAVPEQALRIKIIPEIKLQDMGTELHCRMVKLEKDRQTRSVVGSVEIS